MQNLSLMERQIVTEPSLRGAAPGTSFSLIVLRRSYAERFGPPKNERLFFQAVSRLAEFGFLETGPRRSNHRMYAITAHWATATEQAITDALAASPTDSAFLAITPGERESLMARTETMQAEAPANHRTVLPDVAHDLISGIAGERTRWGANPS